MGFLKSLVKLKQVDNYFVKLLVIKDFTITSFLLQDRILSENFSLTHHWKPEKVKQIKQINESSIRHKNVVSPAHPH